MKVVHKCCRLKSLTSTEGLIRLREDDGPPANADGD